MADIQTALQIMQNYAAASRYRVAIAADDQNTIVAYVRVDPDRPPEQWPVHKPDGVEVDHVVVDGQHISLRKTVDSTVDEASLAKWAKSFDYTIQAAGGGEVADQIDQCDKDAAAFAALPEEELAAMRRRNLGRG